MEQFVKLYRFTRLPFLMDMLFNEHLTLLSPDRWEDKNDKAIHDE